MQNQFVQIKVLKIHYRKNIATFTQRLPSNYDGHFKVSVCMGSKRDDQQDTTPPAII